MAQFKIFGHCQATHLFQLIASNNYTSAIIDVEVEQGAGIRWLVSMVYAHGRSQPQDTTFVCPGVIDMLYTDPSTGISSLHFNTVAELTDHITALLNEGDINFHQVFPQSHIVFAPITGLDLSRYSMTNDDDAYHQYIANAGVARINEEIIAINEHNHVPNPWSSQKVHRIRKSQSGRTYFTQRYQYLTDGCDYSIEYFF